MKMLKNYTYLFSCNLANFNFIGPKFKARKMPDMSLPFFVFKNEKELTKFDEFDITLNYDENLNMTLINQKSQENLMRSFQDYPSKTCKTPENVIDEHIFTQFDFRKYN
jgi:hypothetical protein